MTRKRLAAAAGMVLVAAAVTALLVARHKRSPGAAPSEHAAGVDYEMTPLLAMYKAPEGGTPCETAYNAFRAFDDASKGTNRGAPWVSLPDQSTFLERCNVLPRQDQECLQPRYAAKHHDLCDPVQNRIRNDKSLLEWRSPPM